MTNQTTKLTIQAGKTYKNHLGDIVSLSSTGNEDYSHDYPFLGSNCELYTAQGAYYLNQARCDLDLIKEVIPPTEFKLQDGKTYLNRTGEIVTVQLSDEGTIYKFRSLETQRSYTETGMYWNGEENPNDIIKEYTPPLEEDEVPSTLPSLTAAEARATYNKEKYAQVLDQITGECYRSTNIYVEGLEDEHVVFFENLGYVVSKQLSGHLINW